MESPVQITFRDIPASPAITAYVEKRAAKLETLFQRMVNCHVVVEEPHRHNRQGKKFHVRIDMLVPGKELVVSKTPDDSKEDLYAAPPHAFSRLKKVDAPGAAEFAEIAVEYRNRTPRRAVVLEVGTSG